MLSYPAMSVLHRGQRDRGVTTDWPAGMREMHTFRKLPTMRPITPMRIMNCGVIEAEDPAAGAEAWTLETTTRVRSWRHRRTARAWDRLEFRQDQPPGSVPSILREGALWRRENR